MLKRTTLQEEEISNNRALRMKSNLRPWRWGKKFRGKWVAIHRGEILGNRGFETLGEVDRYLDYLKGRKAPKGDVLIHYFRKQRRPRAVKH